MKFHGIIKANFTGDYWEYTIFQNTSTGINERTYSFVKTMDLIIVPSTVQVNGMSVFTDEPLMQSAQIQNIKDSNGTPLYSDDGVTAEPATIGAMQPVTDVWGKIIGYRYQLSRGAQLNG